MWLKRPHGENLVILQKLESPWRACMHTEKHTVTLNDASQAGTTVFSLEYCLSLIYI